MSTGLINEASLQVNEQFREIWNEMHRISLHNKLATAVDEFTKGNETNQANELVRRLAGKNEEDAALRKKLNDTFTRIASQI